MNNDFKNKLKSNISQKRDNITLNTDIKSKNEEVILDPNVNTNISNAFTLGTKVETTTKKKPFPLYLDAETQKDLEHICKKKKYSRNELIVMMIKHCIETIEYTD